ncbi:MAG: PsbP-related protein [Planctomycetota bacterium]
MVIRRALPFALFVALLSFPAPTAADTVEFNNGRTLEGEVIEETDDQITLKFDGGQVTFPKKMIKAVRRSEKSTDEGSAASGATTSGATDEAVAPLLAGTRPASEDWSLLWSPERRVGWRQVQARMDSDGAMFDEEVVFVDADGRPSMSTHLTERSGADLYPLSFQYREASGEKELLRKGRVEGRRLHIETIVNGKKERTDHPLPPGFRMPMAARAFVLGEAERLPGGWKGVTYDSRTGKFVHLHLRAYRTERFLWEGSPVDVLVLSRERGGVLEEERVTREGRTLTADLNGSGLTAVGTTRRRLELFRDGAEVPENEEEKRAKTLHVDPENGFRILKPGAAWEFRPGARSGNPRVTVRDVGGIAFVEVSVDDAPAGTPLEAHGAALEKTMRARAADFTKLEDGFDEVAGQRAYRLLCDVKLKGDELRTTAFVVVKGDRVWTLTATCPRKQWDEARPFLERILAGFEWL